MPTGEINLEPLGPGRGSCDCATSTATRTTTAARELCAPKPSCDCRTSLQGIAVDLLQELQVHLRRIP